MANAFFIYDPTGSGNIQQRDDKILPDPVTMDVNYPVIDGKVEEVTATSGVDQYLIVHPGDFPTTADQRQARRGSVR